MIRKLSHIYIISFLLIAGCDSLGGDDRETLSIYTSDNSDLQSLTDNLPDAMAVKDVAISDGITYLVMTENRKGVISSYPQGNFAAEIFLGVKNGSSWSAINLSDGSSTLSLNPVLLANKNGEVVVSWGEQESIENSLLGADELHYSIGKNLTWFAPQVAYRGDIAPHESICVPIAMIENSSGEILASVSFANLTGTDRVELLNVKNSGHWSLRSIVESEDASKPSLTRTDSDELVVSFSGIDEAGIENGDKNQIFFSRSRDGGETWSERKLVLASGNSPSHFPTIVESNGVVHVLVARSTEGRIFPNELWYVNSFDGGLTWEPPVQVIEGESGFIGKAQLLKDSKGGVHALYYFAPELGSPTGNELKFISWESNDWKVKEVITSAPTAQSKFAATISEEDVLEVYYSERLLPVETTYNTIIKHSSIQL